MDTVIGVDLSGLTRKSRGDTVAAHLALGPPWRLVEPTFLAPRQQAGDVALVAWIRARAPEVVAIDAPLTLPHSIICRATVCSRCELGRANYLTRDIERAVGGMSAANLGPIAFRGMYLARQLRQHGHTVIECYPAAAFRVLGLRSTELEGRRRVLARLIKNVGWDEDGRLADQVDAMVAAVVAADHVNGHAERAPGEDGELWLPRRDDRWA